MTEARAKAAEALRQLRENGWSVAVHNDYQQAGEKRTFWLLTHPNGRWVKGEGTTDDEALALAALSAEVAAVPADREGLERATDLWNEISEIADDTRCILILASVLESAAALRQPAAEEVEAMAAWLEEHARVQHSYSSSSEEAPA